MKTSARSIKKKKSLKTIKKKNASSPPFFFYLKSASQPGSFEGSVNLLLLILS